MLRTAVLPTVASTALVAVVCWVIGGPAAAAGALVGAAVTVLILTVGLLVLKVVLNGPAPTALAGALAVYLVQLSVLLGLLLALRAGDLVHPGGFAAGALSATVVWQTGHIVGLSRARRLVYDPPSSERVATREASDV